LLFLLKISGRIFVFSGKQITDMKKFIPFLFPALFVVACNSNPEKPDVKTLQSTQQPVQDTAGLAAFQQWKTQNELNAAAQPQSPQPNVAEAAPVKTVTHVRVVEKPAPQRKKETILQKEPRPTQSTDKTLPATDNTGTANTGNGTAASTGTTDTKTAPAEAEKKEGWSKSAKGAVIGGVGGAVLGGVVNKRNRAAGAVIGGILGAGVGYGIGKSKDKKDSTHN
jgi:hypothetical protein